MVNDTNKELQIFFKAFSYLTTHWWLFLFEFAVIFGIYMAKYYGTPNVFESTASILIDPSKRNLYLSQFAKRISRRKLRVERVNLAQLLKSDDVMLRLRKKITTYYNAEGRPPHLRVLFPNGVANSAKDFSDNIFLTWNRDSDIFNIRCTAQNPDAAHDLCFIYVNTVERIYPEIVQRRLLLQQEFLNRQIATLSSQIAERELELANYEQKDEDFFDFLIMSHKNPSRLPKLRAEMLKLKQKMDIAEETRRMYASLPQKKGVDHTSVKVSAEALNTRIAEIKYQKHLTSQLDSVDKTERLAALDKELHLLTKQATEVNKEANRLFTQTPVNFESVRDKLATIEMNKRVDSVKIKRLEREIDDTKDRQKKFRRRQLSYNRKSAEINYSKGLLKTLYQKEQDTQLELSIGSSEVFRLQKPTRNTGKIEPHLTKHLFASISITLFVCLFTAFLLTIFLPRIDSESEVHRLNLPVLGKVPVCNEKITDVSAFPPYTLEYLKIMNYRILRETKDVKSPVVIITSPQPGEGKSTISYYLNMASHNPERKVLIIDGDLITAHPSDFFGVSEDATPGLRSILDNPSETVDPKKLVVQSRFKGIDFLPRGGRTQVLSSPEYLKPVKSVVEQLRSEYDMIYIDTPPLFTSNLSHQWAGMADLIVLVARMFYTRPNDLTEALQTCKIFSRAPVGIALNAIRPTGQHRRTSSYYYFSRKRPKKTA